MIRLTFFLLSFILFLSCSTGKKTADASNKPKATDTASLQSELQNNPDAGIDAFLKKFEIASVSHSPARIMRFMDPQYRIDQHDIFLNKDTRTFLDNFFSGNNTETGSYQKIDYTTIIGLHRKSLTHFQGYTSITYTISTPTTVIETTWVLYTKMNLNFYEYFLYGPVG